MKKKLLEVFPLDWQNADLDELHKMLAYLNGGEWTFKSLADAAGIEPGTFPSGINDLDIAKNLMEVMAKQKKLLNLVEEAGKYSSPFQDKLKEALKIEIEIEVIVNSDEDSIEIFKKELKETQLIGGEVPFLDRTDLREYLDLLANKASPVKVILVRGEPKSGKSYARYLFDYVASKHDAQPIYLFDGIISTVDEVVLQLFSAFGASDEIPNNNTTSNAWYKLVCIKLMEIAERKQQALWIAIDDLGLDSDDIPLFDVEIKKFCDQFALHMINPLFRKWFRVMLINYPEGEVPTNWKRNMWKEDKTSVGDIQEDHIKAFLLFLQEKFPDQKLIESELNSLATEIFETGTEANPESGKLAAINNALEATITRFKRQSS